MYATRVWRVGDYIHKDYGNHFTMTYSPVEKERENDNMTNEQIKNEINEATSKFRETTRVANEALNHAAGRLDKAEKEAYDRGLNDCWEMLNRVYRHDGFTSAELDEIFETSNWLSYIGGVLTNHTPQQALEKIRAWEEKKAEEERKKQEEAEKIQIGDVVEVCENDGDPQFFGVYCGESVAENCYWVINKRCDVPQKLSKNLWILKKTNSHVCILESLK